jgi:hypothetical protein
MCLHASVIPIHLRPMACDPTLDVSLENQFVAKLEVTNLSEA